MEYKIRKLEAEIIRLQTELKNKTELNNLLFDAVKALSSGPVEIYPTPLYKIENKAKKNKIIPDNLII